MNDDDLAKLQKFIVYLYDKGSADDKVNDARMTLFTHKNKNYDDIPPTEDALRMHALRATYQAGHIWSQSLVPNPQLPSPGNWGWNIQNGGKLEINWTEKDPIAKACKELKCCQCKTECKRCKCAKALLPCTSLCSCTC